MKVTRDVIYDLLPAYFADEVSADTRALIDEFFASDPEFGRIAERFRLLHQESRQGGSAESEANQERETFDRVKTQIRRRQAAMMWGVSALMALGMAVLAAFDGRGGFRHPGVVIGLVFAAMAVGTWFSPVKSGGAWAASMREGDGTWGPGKTKDQTETRARVAPTIKEDRRWRRNRLDD